MEVISKCTLPEDFLIIGRRALGGTKLLKEIHVDPGLSKAFDSDSSISAYDPDNGKVFIDLFRCLPPNYFARLGACMASSTWLCLLHQFFLRVCMAEEVEADPSLLENDVPPEETVVRAKERSESELLSWAINGGTVPTMDRLGWFAEELKRSRTGEDPIHVTLLDKEEEALHYGGIASVEGVIESGLVHPDKERAESLLAMVRDGEIGVRTPSRSLLELR